MTGPDNNEANFFAELESSMEQDLTTWRAELVEFFESNLPLVIDLISEARGVPVDLSNADDHALVGAALRNFILDRWKEIRNAPLEDDAISASGRGIYQVYNEDSFDFNLTNETTKIHGKVIGFDLQPYMDRSYFNAIDEYDGDEEPDDEFIRPYRMPFGLHLVLSDVFVTDAEMDVPHHISGKLVYLPLHYPDIELRAVAA